MSGISLYFHIPFCRKACPYCDFYFSTDQSFQASFFSALKKEILLKKKLVAQKINSIYFGGGTPSTAKLKSLAEVLDLVKSLNAISRETEITLEINEEDISYEKLKNYLNIGFNRFSIGIQSIRKNLSPYLGRYVDYNRVKEITIMLAKLSIKSYSFDLIYGIPSLSIKDWANDLGKIINLAPPHLSLYALTVEKKTRLDYLLQQKKLNSIKDNLAKSHLKKAIVILNENGYEHYEISNWARENKYSKHNWHYWQRKDYLGFGPGAVSFLENKRVMNLPRLKSYINFLQLDQPPPQEVEFLTETNQINEAIMLSLRTNKGLDLDAFAKEFGEEKKIALLKKAHFGLEKKLLQQKEKNFLKATTKGKFVLDAITRELIF